MHYGVTKLIADKPSGAIGPPTGTFVIPKAQADLLIQKAGGNIRELEKSLGLDPGVLGNSPFRVDVKVPKGLRMSDGRELGANEKWLPGGKTSGGVLEATVDQIQSGTYSVTKILK